MIATVAGVTVEGTPSEIAELMRAMRTQESGTDTACLTPSERDAFKVLAKHVNGAHYEVIAQELGITPAAANSRLQALMSKKMCERIQAGIYKAVS